MIRGPLLDAILVAMCVGQVIAAPDYFASVANQALRLEGGAVLGRDLGVRAVTELEQQVKRVLGADPSQELNVSSVRELSDPELLRLLFLAVMGNFTSAAGASWQQPCSLVVDTHSGLVRAQDVPPIASLALKVVVILLVAVQFKQWVAEVRATRQLVLGPPEDHQKGKGH
jgi:hypothetical protein